MTTTNKNITKMKKSALLFNAMLIAGAATIGFTSCGDDDNDSPKTDPVKKATTATVQGGFYVTASEMKYMDIYVIDANGDSTLLTTSNTTVNNNMSFGNVYKMSYTTSASAIANNGDEARLYTFSVETIKTFPKKLTYEVAAKPNGNQPSDNENIVILYAPALNIQNDAEGFTSFNSHLSSSTLVINGAKWTTYIEKAGAKKGMKIELNFTSASDLDNQLTETFLNKK